MFQFQVQKKQYILILYNNFLDIKILIQMTLSRLVV